ncbi:DUF397 domain-containing protein [Streptomyces yunnanensis]|uniref:DUF397 domain-containing protein n=1 Tax=Streptomyces yunnanensis TaxID=156453 RepID=A0A9X8MN18_9ACTN|nr:DUF397 domain-containing protein [Streptomyces yunnanensis]SHL16062.1 protein of unknown function [Streptomyces yunnanensis]
MTSAAAPHTSDDLTWFKSSYSSDQGGACLEAAYDWRKSSYSGSAGGNCLEVAASPGPHLTIHIRDSKNPGGPVLTLGADAWGAFVVDVAVRA